VTQQDLNGAEIDPGFEQMRSEGEHFLIEG
jgi:hypothetical protein